METLLLHWNKIRGKGALALAKAIKYNESIEILDLSFNSFGGVGAGSSRRACISVD